MANFLEWVVPTAEGEKTYFLLTQEGVDNLLTPIEVGDLGELASLLLTMQSQIVEQSKSIEEQGKLIEDQSKLIQELEEKINNGTTTESKVDIEINFLKENDFTATEIAKRYNKSNTNKNGVSTTEIYNKVGGTGNPT